MSAYAGSAPHPLTLPAAVPAQGSSGPQGAGAGRDSSDPGAPRLTAGGAPDPAVFAGPAGRSSPAERLGELFDAVHQRLWRLACRMVGDPEEARDLVQETFLRAAGQAARLPEREQAAEAWLFRILVNLCRDQYRRRAVRVRAELLARGVPAGKVSAGDPESQAIARNLVAALLACLTPRRRAVVTLHEMEGLSVRRIAALLRLREVTVRWHLARGRRQMATLLSQHPGEGRIKP